VPDSGLMVNAPVWVVLFLQPAANSADVIKINESLFFIAFKWPMAKMHLRYGLSYNWLVCQIKLR